MNPELTHYLHMIEDLRGQVREVIDGLPAEALNWRSLPVSDAHETNSLAVMAAHVAGAEHFWIAEVIGGYPTTRDRPAEFVTDVDGPDSLLAGLDKVGAETRQVFARLTAADLDETRLAHEQAVTTRWAILHVVDHTALHLGHMQITYQLWMGGGGKPSPRWYERLP